MPHSARALLLTNSEIRDDDLQELSRSGLKFEVATNLYTFLTLLEATAPEVAIIDYRLIASSPRQVCSEIRSLDHGRCVELIVFSCASSSDALLEVLEAGADRSIAGDIGSREFRLTACAAARNTHPIQRRRLLIFGDLELDLERLKVFRGDKAVFLPTIQFRLLKRFLEEPTAVLSYEKLLEDVWEGRPLEKSAVKVAIIRLRKALYVEGKKDVIRTVKGVGYALDVEERCG